MNLLVFCCNVIAHPVDDEYVTAPAVLDVNPVDGNMKVAPTADGKPVSPEPLPTKFIAVILPLEIMLFAITMLALTLPTDITFPRISIFPTGGGLQIRP